MNNFRALRQKKSDIIEQRKVKYYKNKIDECNNDSSKLHKIVNDLLGKNLESSKLPTETDRSTCAEKFKDHFVNKVNEISSSFNLQSGNYTSEPSVDSAVLMSEFLPITN